MPTVSHSSIKGVGTRFATPSFQQQVYVLLGCVFSKVAIRDNLAKDVLERPNWTAAERQKPVVMDLIDICPAAWIDADVQRRRSLLPKPEIASTVPAPMEKSGVPMPL